MNAMICTLVLISFATFQINAYDNGRDSYKRIDPDSTTAGFFPVWGVVHLILAGFFLIVAAVGFLGYLLGCRTPQESRHPSTDSTAPFFVIQNFATAI